MASEKTLALRGEPLPVRVVPVKPHLGVNRAMARTRLRMGTKAEKVGTLAYERKYKPVAAKKRLTRAKREVTIILCAMP